MCFRFAKGMQMGIYNGQIVYNALVVSSEMKSMNNKTSYDNFVIQDWNILKSTMRNSSLRIMSVRALHKALQLLFDIEKDLSVAYERAPTYEEVRFFLRKMQLRSYQELRKELKESKEVDT